MIAFSGVSFAFRHGWLRPVTRPILHQLTWTVEAGTRVALVGPSGSGKSTLIGLALGLLRPDAGRVQIDGIDPAASRGASAMRLRRTVQWVPQHPEAAFDPRMSVGTSLREALVVHGVSGPAATAEIAALIDRLNLSGRLLGRQPGDLSGGEVQRFALARALLLDPKVLLLDEPTSMLDVSVQAEIIRLTMALQAERSLTVVLVTHDRALAHHFADRIDEIDHGGIGNAPVLMRVSNPGEALASTHV